MRVSKIILNYSFRNAYDQDIAIINTMIQSITLINSNSVNV